MKKTILVVIILLISSCTTISQQVTPTVEIIVTSPPTETATLVPSATAIPTITTTPLPSIRPDDFQIEYHWSEGSLPEPYYYTYVITINPDGEGHIQFSPDYSSNNPPQWEDTFSVNETQLDYLYTQLLETGALTGTWQENIDPPIGGSSDHLEVNVYGQHISIPSFAEDEQNERDINKIEAYMETVVPEAVWEKLNTLHEQYIVAHE